MTTQTVDLRYIRLQPGTKLPVDAGWQHRPLTASEVDKTARAVHVGASGLLVVDEDGPEGTVDQWLAATGRPSLPVTLNVRTASGKLHRYYALPPGVIHPTTRIRVDGFEVDLLAGNRYVVAPPTETPDGTYRSLEPYEITAAPEWLIDLVTGAAATETASPEATAAMLATLVDPDGEPCRYMVAVSQRWVERITESGEHCHGEGVSGTFAIAASGAAGHRGAARAMDAVREAFLSVRVPSVGTADHEYESLARSAWGKAAALDVHDTDRCTCDLEQGCYVFKGQLFARKLCDAVEAIGPIAADDGKRLYAYLDGTWDPDGQRVVIDRCARLLRDDFRPSHANAVQTMLANRAPMFTEDTVDTEHLNLPNGLLRWATGELLPHSPEVPNMIRIPVEWEATATCPGIDGWLREVLPSDSVEFAYELMGYALFNGLPHHAAVMLYGKGRNGKGTLLTLLTTLLGAKNTSSVPPQMLGENRFAAAELRGKLANLVGDVSPRMFKDTDVFKKATGQDLITAERKYGHPFQFKSRALTVAAYNRRPRTADTTEGFFSRWLVLPFVGYFPDGVKVPEIADKLATPDELRGLLVAAVEGLQRVMSRGGFEPLPESVREATAGFRDYADTMRSFVAECCERYDGRGQAPTRRLCSDIYAVWKQFNAENGTQPGSAARFHEHLCEVATDMLGTVVEVRRTNGRRVVDGLRLTAETWESADR